MKTYLPITFANVFFMTTIVIYNHYGDFFSVSEIGMYKEKILSSPNSSETYIYDLLVTGTDALSYGRLVRAEGQVCLCH